MANLEGEAGTRESVSQCSSPGGSRSGSSKREDFFSSDITQLNFGCYVVTRIPRVCGWFCLALELVWLQLCGGYFLGKLTLYLTIWLVSAVVVCG